MWKTPQKIVVRTSQICMVSVYMPEGSSKQNGHYLCNITGLLASACTKAFYEHIIVWRQAWIACKFITINCGQFLCVLLEYYAG